MWPATGGRYDPLLPSPDSRGPRLFKNTLASRCSILVIASAFAVVIIIGAVRIFGIQVTFALKHPDIISPEISPERLISSDTDTAAEDPDTWLPPDSPTDVPAADSYSKEHLFVDEMRVMISQTRGFYTRDYSLGLGWNNVRYILEAAVFQAKLLNRTLIIPSFVYARSCAYELSVCADEAPMMNKGDAVGWDTWRDLPVDQQMAWQIPISVMVNITQLRRFHPVITTADYLQYVGLPPTVETTSGYWDRDAYHQSPDPSASHVDRTSEAPTLFVIQNSWFDPEGVIRVDSIPDAVKHRSGWIAGNTSIVQSSRWEKQDNDAACLLLKHLLQDKNVVDWEEARHAVEELVIRMPQSVGTSSPNSESDEFIEEVLNQNGWEVLHTFQGAAGMDFIKHVVMPTRQVAQRTSLRGFVEDYAHIDADVVVLAGETHLFRKPGQMRFSTLSARELFQNLVLRHVVPVDKVHELAKKFDHRMSALNGERQWMGAHVRRGDFVSAGWAWGDESHEEHLERVKKHLDEGRRLLHSEHRHAAYSVPNITVDASMRQREPPEQGDRFFIATDESDADKLAYFSANGAIMFKDLVTFEDRREFGWEILFSDIVGLVEQATLARASYFYGSAMSSFAGGVFNMRAVLGAEEITALAD